MCVLTPYINKITPNSINTSNWYSDQHHKTDADRNMSTKQ